ncbi:MAG: hypothetical protein ACI9N0_002349 [Ilumatobacter sp.]|jgi:hypothetical protein
MLLAAEFGTGQVLWSMLWFFLFFVWIMLVFQTFGDIFRSDDLPGLSKAIWTLLIVFMPYLGVFIYLIVRGDTTSDRVSERPGSRCAELHPVCGRSPRHGRPAEVTCRSAHRRQAERRRVHSREERHHRFLITSSPLPARTPEGRTVAAAHGVGLRVISSLCEPPS